MPVRIQTRQQMDSAKAAMGFCYLCGKSLGTEGVHTEHVLAKALLPPPPSASAWPVTLPVHGRCDDTLKQPNDDVLIAVQRIHSRALWDSHKSDRAVMRKRILEAEASGLPESFAAFDAAACIRSVWASVRGFHAALYGQFLPEAHKHPTFAPVPGISTRDATPLEEQMRREEWMSDRVILATNGALLANEWDGITAWDKLVEYRCIWHILPETRREQTMCLWTLSTPQVLYWSRSTIGVERPWRGVYRMPSPPPNASVLSDRAIDELNREEGRSANAPALAQLVRRAGQPF